MHTIWFFIIYVCCLGLMYVWQITFLFCSVCGYHVFFWYVLLLHISLIISMHCRIHVALTAFIRLLHCLFGFVFAVYLCCVGCSCFTATFCGYWVLLPGLLLFVCTDSTHVGKAEIHWIGCKQWWQNMYNHIKCKKGVGKIQYNYTLIKIQHISIEYWLKFITKFL